MTTDSKCFQFYKETFNQCFPFILNYILLLLHPGLSEFSSSNLRNSVTAKLNASVIGHFEFLFSRGPGIRII